MFARLKLWAIAAGGVLLAVLAAFGMGRREGRQQATTKQLRRRVDAGKEARQVQDEVNKRSDDDVRSQLDGWMRDDPRD